MKKMVKKSCTNLDSRLTVLFLFPFQFIGIILCIHRVGENCHNIREFITLMRKVKNVLNFQQPKKLLYLPTHIFIILK